MGRSNTAVRKELTATEIIGDKTERIDEEFRVEKDFPEGMRVMYIKSRVTLYDGIPMRVRLLRRRHFSISVLGNTLFVLGLHNPEKRYKRWRREDEVVQAALAWYATQTIYPSNVQFGGKPNMRRAGRKKT